MNNQIYLYAVGTFLAAAVSASLFFGWAPGATAAERGTAALTAPVEIALTADRPVRIILASPYAR
jgi:hypothetical protein